MKRIRKYGTGLLIGLLLMVVTNVSYAADAPPKVASALLLKLVAFEMSLMNKGGEIAIHVIGSPELADALQKAVGKPIGKCKLGKVTVSDALPETKPSVLCLTKGVNVSDVLEYTRKGNILSVTNIPELVAEGISLGVGVGADGKPKILLNMTSSVEEELDWNPAILKVVKIVKDSN